LVRSVSVDGVKSDVTTIFDGTVARIALRGDQLFLASVSGGVLVCPKTGCADAGPTVVSPAAGTSLAVDESVVFIGTSTQILRVARPAGDR
jgi:hypothetical protein